MTTFFKRKLPHIYPENNIFFITFRLADSLPQSTLKLLKEDRILDELNTSQKELLESHILRSKRSQMVFERYEAQLDGNKYGECILQELQIAKILSDRMKKYDGEFYNLICFTIMPNHVHLLFDTNTDDRLIASEKNDTVISRVMQLIKGGSAFEINIELDRKGKLWATESFDRYIRNNTQFQNIYSYIIDNPSKAGLNSEFNKPPYQFENLEYGE